MSSYPFDGDGEQPQEPLYRVTQPPAPTQPKPKVKPTTEMLQKHAVEQSLKYGVDPALTLALLGNESSFNPNAVSPKGARNVGQVMPGTARTEAPKYGLDPNKVLTDPFESINFTVRHLDNRLSRYGDVESALRAYNAGDAAIEKSKKYPETNNYVAAIRKAQDAYAQDLAPQLATFYQQGAEPQPVAQPTTVDPNAPNPVRAPEHLGQEAAGAYQNKPGVAQSLGREAGTFRLPLAPPILRSKVQTAPPETAGEIPERVGVTRPGVTPAPTVKPIQRPQAVKPITVSADDLTDFENLKDSAARTLADENARNLPDTLRVGQDILKQAQGKAREIQKKYGAAVEIGGLGEGEAPYVKAAPRAAVKIQASKRTPVEAPEISGVSTSQGAKSAPSKPSTWLPAQMTDEEYQLGAVQPDVWKQWNPDWQAEHARRQQAAGEHVAEVQAKRGTMDPRGMIGNEVISVLGSAAGKTISGIGKLFGVDPADEKQAAIMEATARRQIGLAPEPQPSDQNVLQRFGAHLDDVSRDLSEVHGLQPGLSKDITRGAVQAALALALRHPGLIAVQSGLESYGGGGSLPEAMQHGATSYASMEAMGLGAGALDLTTLAPATKMLGRWATNVAIPLATDAATGQPIPKTTEEWVKEIAFGLGWAAAHHGAKGEGQEGRLRIGDTEHSVQVFPEGTAPSLRQLKAQGMVRTDVDGMTVVHPAGLKYGDVRNAVRSNGLSYGGEMPPVPETSETLDAQMQALRDGRKSAVLVTPGAEMPASAESLEKEGFQVTPTKQGTFIHNDSVTPEEIRDAAENGTHGGMLDYLKAKPRDGEPSVTVVARDQAGRELQSAVTKPEDAAQQAAKLQEVFPGATVGAEHPAQVIGERVAGQMRPTDTASVVQRAQERVDSGQAVDDYAAQFGPGAKDSRGWDISASNARTVLAPEARTSEGLTEHGEALTDTARRLAEHVYFRALEDPKATEVVISLGGTSTGKTSAHQGEAQRRGSIVFESHGEDVEALTAMIQEALDRGKQVTVNGITREPRASYESTIERFKTGEQAGKVVPLDRAAQTHATAPAAFGELKRRFGGDVDFRAIDNTGQVPLPARSMPTVSYEEARNQMSDVLDRAHREGRLSDDEYSKFSGGQVPVGVEPARASDQEIGAQTKEEVPQGGGETRKETPEGPRVEPVTSEVTTPVTGFTTARGSAYTYKDGRTQRVKAARPEHPGDEGLKERSDKTVFLNDKDAQQVGMWQTLQAEGKRIVVHNNEVILTSLNPKTGERGSDGRFQFSTEPQVGLAPLELWGRSESLGKQGFEAYRGNHPGNVITKVETGQTERRVSDQGPPEGQPERRGAIVSESEARVSGPEGVVKRAREGERRAKTEGAIDALTGLQSQSQWLGAKSRIEADPNLAIARLDFNDLKKVNDQHGHSEGDAYIRRGGEIAREEAQKAGLADRGQFRTGGDEFTLTGEPEALQKVAEAVQKRVSEEIELPTGQRGSVAIGVDKTEADADEKMYAQKREMKAAGNKPETKPAAEPVKPAKEKPAVETKAATKPAIKVGDTVSHPKLSDGKPLKVTSVGEGRIMFRRTDTGKEFGVMADSKIGRELQPLGTEPAQPRAEKGATGAAPRVELPAGNRPEVAAPRDTQHEARQESPSVPEAEPSANQVVKDIERIGTARVGDRTAKIVEHPSGKGYGVEMTIAGDRRLPLGDSMTLKDAREEAARLLTAPEPGQHPANYQPRTADGKFDGEPEYPPDDDRAREPRKFSSTQINLSKADAEPILAFGRMIPERDLAADGRELESHVTLKFGLHTGDVEDVRPLLEGEGPIKATLGKTKVFEGVEDGTADAVVVEVKSPDLERLNQKVGALEHTDTHPDYQPHLTIAYVKPGLGKKYAGRTDFEGKKISVDEVMFSGKDRTETPISLTSKVEEGRDETEHGGVVPARASEDTRSEREVSARGTEGGVESAGSERVGDQKDRTTRGRGIQESVGGKDVTTKTTPDTDRVSDSSTTGAVEDVAEKPITDAKSLRDAFKEKFKLSDEEADSVSAVADAHAEAWAKINGKDKDEWYGRLAGVEQGGEVGEAPKQGAKGATQFLEDGRAIIHAFESADVSTAAHELGHVFRRDLPVDDLKVAEEWAGVKDGEWKRVHEERFARGFEKYLSDGEAPNEALKGVFEKFKTWLQSIYQRITGSEIDVKISPEMKAVFSRMLGGEGTVTSEVTGTEAQKPGWHKIEDFGEKIGGARKDTATTRGGKEKEIKEGGGDDPSWRKRFKLSQITKSSDPSEEGKWAVYDTKNKDWTGQPRQVGRSLFDSKEAAEKAVELAAVSQKHIVVMGAPDADGNSTYTIWRRVTDRKRVQIVKREFSTREEAMKYMASHAPEIIETKTNFGEEILVKPDKVVRTGEERRTGPATKEMFARDFGFRGVEFGNWNNQEERQAVMDHAYDGLHDLANVLGVSPKALSLNGDLGLAFGARGQGLSGAKAHYERDYAVINLTKLSGAGSLAHEWFHAFDHYLGRQDTKASSEKIVNERGDKVYDASGRESDYASHGFSTGKKITREEGKVVVSDEDRSQVRSELRAAYQGMIDTLFTKAEKYVSDTQRAEQFVGAARDAVAKKIQQIRDNSYDGLSRDMDSKYRSRKNKAASTEQLAEFDRLAEALINGEDLRTQFRSTTKPGVPAKSRGGMAGRFTNDTLDAIDSILKDVRGRGGFNAEQKGNLDDLRREMTHYQQRIDMLESARSGEVKTKKVPTGYAMEAKKIDQGRASDYWTTPHEMAARAFSSYIEDKIQDEGHQSDFLSYGADNKHYQMMGVRPFPEGAEREVINKAFDKLFETVQEKEGTTGGTVLYQEQGGLTEAAKDYLDSLNASELRKAARAENMGDEYRDYARQRLEESGLETRSPVTFEVTRDGETVWRGKAEDARDALRQSGEKGPGLRATKVGPSEEQKAAGRSVIQTVIAKGGLDITKPGVQTRGELKSLEIDRPGFFNKDSEFTPHKMAEELRDSGFLMPDGREPQDEHDLVELIDREMRQGPQYSTAKEYDPEAEFDKWQKSGMSEEDAQDYDLMKRLQENEPEWIDVAARIRSTDEEPSDEDLNRFRELSAVHGLSDDAIEGFIDAGREGREGDASFDFGANVPQESDAGETATSREGEREPGQREGAVKPGLEPLFAEALKPKLRSGADKIDESSHWNFGRSEFSSSESEEAFRNVIKNAAVKSGGVHKVKVTQADIAAAAENILQLHPEAVREIAEWRPGKGEVVPSVEAVVAAAKFAQSLTNEAVKIREQLFEGRRADGTPLTSDEIEQMETQAARYEYDAGEVMVGGIGVRSQKGRELSLLKTVKPDNLGEWAVNRLSKLWRNAGKEPEGKAYAETQAEVQRLTSQIKALENREARQKRYIDELQGNRPPREKPVREKKKSWEDNFQDRMVDLEKEARDRLTRLGILKPETPKGETVLYQEDDDGTRTVARGFVPPRFEIKKPIKGPTGAKSIGYEWKSKIGEKWSNRKQEYVEARVSDWDASETSTGTGRDIVHAFYVEHPDGSIKVEGIRSAQKVLGISESRLQTIAKNEQARQAYEQEAHVREIKSLESVAKETPREAAQWYRRINYSSMRSAEENDAIFNESRLLEKDGKFLRGSPARVKLLEPEGWRPVDDAGKAQAEAEARVRKDVEKTGQRYAVSSLGNGFFAVKDRLTGEIARTLENEHAAKTDAENMNKRRDILYQMPDISADIATVMAAKLARSKPGEQNLEDIRQEMRNEFGEHYRQERVDELAHKIVLDERRTARLAATKEPASAPSAQAALGKELKDAEKARRQAVAELERTKRQSDKAWALEQQRSAKEREKAVSQSPDQELSEAEKQAQIDRAFDQYEAKQGRQAETEQERDAARVEKETMAALDAEKYDQWSADAKAELRNRKLLDQEAKRQLAEEARERAAQARKDAAEGDRNAAQALAREKREAEKRARDAQKWETPVRLNAEAATIRLSDPDRLKSKDAVEDLARVGAGKLTQPGMNPTKWRQEMSAYGKAYTDNEVEIRDRAGEIFSEAKKAGRQAEVARQATTPRGQFEVVRNGKSVWSGQAANMADALRQAGAGQGARARRVSESAAGAMTSEQIEQAVNDYKATIKAKQEAQKQLANTFNGLRESWWDRASTLIKAGLLSAPRTLAKIVTAHSGFLAAEELSKMPASLVDMVASVISGNDRQVGGASLSAMQHAAHLAATRGMREGWSIMKTGHTGATVQDVFTKASKEGSSPLDVREFHSGVPLLDTYVNAVMRSHGSAYHVLKMYALDRALTEQADLAARSEADRMIQSKKLDKSDRAGYVARRLGELRDKPSNTMIANAIEAAEVATFINDNPFASAVSKVKGAAGPVGRFIIDRFIPFPKVPSNVAARVLEYTAGVPYSLGKQLMFDSMRGKDWTPERQRNFSETFGRGTIGLGLMALGYGLAKSGLATGSQQDLEKKGALRVGGRWYQIGQISPVGNLVSLGASLYELKQGDYLNKGKAVGETLKDLIAEQPMLKGMENVGELAQGVFENDKTGGAKRQAGSVIGSLVPTAVADVAAQLDRTQRRKETLGDYVKARMPGVRKSLPERIGPGGEPVSETNKLFDPFQSRSVNEPVMNRTLAERMAHEGMVEQMPHRQVEEEGRQRLDTMRDISARMKRGENVRGLIDKAVSDEVISAKDAQSLVHGGQKSDLSKNLTHLGLSEAAKAWSKMTPTERQENRGVIMKKIVTAERDRKVPHDLRPWVDQMRAGH